MFWVKVHKPMKKRSFLTNSEGPNKFERYKMGKDILNKMMVAEFVLSKEGMILNGKGQDMTSNLPSCTLMA